jgi:hypothetical protein
LFEPDSMVRSYQLSSPSQFVCVCTVVICVPPISFPRRFYYYYHSRLYRSLIHVRRHFCTRPSFYIFLIIRPSLYTRPLYIFNSRPSSLYASVVYFFIPGRCCVCVCWISYTRSLLVYVRCVLIFTAVVDVYASVVLLYTRPLSVRLRYIHNILSRDFVGQLII